MSSVFDLDTRGQAELAETARMSPVLLGDSPASTFTGMFKGIGAGVMRGGARAAQFIGMAGATPLAMLERDPSLGPRAVGMYAPGELTNPYFRALDEYINNAVDYWTPSHAEIGKAGQILGGLSEIALPLMATAGNPALLVGSQELGQATDLTRQNVDAATAVKAGVLEGAASAVGFKLPFLGKTLSTRIASGVLGNVAVGTGTAAAQRQVLDTGGYPELAAQYAPGDVTARAIDALTGAAFGGVAHLQMRPSVREAIATAANAKHFQNDTAPGHPADVAADVAHHAALETAIEQTLRGEPVNAPVDVTQADFLPRERNASVEGRSAAVHENGMAQDADAVHAEYVASQIAEALPGYTVDEGVTHATEESPGSGSGRGAGQQELGRTAAGGPPTTGWADETRIRSSRTPDPLTVYRGGEREVGAEHFTQEALGEKTGHPSSGLGVFFTTSKSEAARWGTVRSAQLDIRNPKVIRNEDLPGFDSVQEARAYSAKLQAQGYDGIVLKNKHLGGKDWVIAFHPKQVIHESAQATKAPAVAETPPKAAAPKTAAIRAAEQAAAEADFQITTGAIDAAGHPVTRSAREMLAEADADIARAQEGAKSIEAAVGCFLRRGE